MQIDCTTNLYLCSEFQEIQVMTNEITLFQSFGLATPSNVTFSESMNAFVGAGYTSGAGNTYFNAARFAEGILIKEDIGEGWRHTFLNGVHIYDLKTRKLLTETVFPMCYGVLYNKEIVKSIATQLLASLLVKAATEQGYEMDIQEVKSKIRTILNRSFENNQIQELNKNIKVLGF